MNLDDELLYQYLRNQDGRLFILRGVRAGKRQATNRLMQELRDKYASTTTEAEEQPHDQP